MFDIKKIAFRANFLTIIALSLITLCCFNTQKCFAEANAVTVPRSTVIPAVATMELSSQNLFQGQNVSVTISNNFYYNNSLVIPLGSAVNGTVTMSQKADKNGNNGKFSILFTNITTPYGSVIPISGMLKTDDNSGVIYGNVTKDNTTDIVKGAVKGASAGAYLDKNNKNNAIQTGSAIGAGTAVSSNNRGLSAVIPVGTVVNVVLNQQSTFKPVEGYQY